MTDPAPVPHVAGIEHVGLVVPDLDGATRFFANVLSAETLYDIGPFTGPEDWMASHLAGPGGGHIQRLRVVQIANGPVLELIELANTAGGPASEPSGSAPPPGWHIAFYVADMDAAVVALRAHGCAIQSGPVEMTEGPSAGLTWLYFQSPWGQQLELVSYPGGIAAYRNRQQEVWRPR